MNLIFRPENHLLAHPVFAWLGLRPPIAQHTPLEHEALKRWATGRRAIIELGVAEGASALALREVMHPQGTLYLIDPFHLSRFRVLNAMKRTAYKTVNRCKNGHVVWIEKFSFEAVQTWTSPADFIFFDGDHSYIGVKRDWEGWNRFVEVGGVVAFHDARIFPGGWTRMDDGPVLLVNELFREGKLFGWKIVEEVDSLVLVERIN